MTARRAAIAAAGWLAVTVVAAPAPSAVAAGAPRATATARTARAPATAVHPHAAARAASGAAAARATLLGGGPQAAVRRAFLAGRGHRRLAIVAILGSTANPAWAAVRAVAPDPGGAATPPARAPAVRSWFYVRSAGSARAANPPRAVRAGLTGAFAVAVVFSGSGSEAVAYSRTYTSACAGAGSFTDQESETVTPMSWSVRWVVDLDRVLAAVGSAGHATLVPSVSFDVGGSQVDAIETVQRTLQDSGCDGNPQTLTCTRTFGAGGSGPASALSFVAGEGIGVAVPLRASTSGSCDPAGYTLGPPLWEQGATAATARALGLLGGRLPADPYAPVAVRWPRDGSSLANGPCAGESGACTDRFSWSGTVQIQPAGHG